LKVECANDERGNLIRELFEYCLFAIPDAERHGPDAPPKCKTKESRGAAYRLLTELGRGCPANFREITSYLTKQLEIINSAIGSNYWSLVPSSTGEWRNSSESYPLLTLLLQKNHLMVMWVFKT
jgi:hypothetical protein